MSHKTDLLVTNARVYTCDPTKVWAEAFAISAGKIAAVGTAAEIAELATADTKVIDAGGQMVLPGLGDVHTHLSLGGTRLAWELAVLPSESLDAILARVKAHATTLAPDEWIIGGVVGSTVMDQLAQGGYLPALDEAAGGRPVMLRDDSHHVRWVSSRALELMGIDQTSPDPEDGTIVRDSSGRLTGLLHEMACALAESAVAASIDNYAERERRSMRTAVELMNSLGITAVQDAATMDFSLRALSELDDEGELSAWVVASLPIRQSFLAEGIVGEELFAAAPSYRRDQVRCDFVKFWLDGVPMTRTSALLEPYICHGSHEDPNDAGPLFFTDDELVTSLERCYELGLGAKLHATGDRSVRQALDAIEVIRDRHGAGPIFQIAHVEFIAESDISRLAELHVVADASPYIWFPNQIADSINNQVPSTVIEKSWPFRQIVDTGALLCGGSDWPVVPMPSPWLAIEAMITRANPDPEITGSCNASGGITLPEAIAAFTCNTAKAIGMGDTVGAIAPGRSADFITLDRNLFDIAPTEIHQTQVLQTYFRGELVYDQSHVS